MAPSIFRVLEEDLLLSYLRLESSYGFLLTLLDTKGVALGLGEWQGHGGCGAFDATGNTVLFISRGWWSQGESGS